MFKTFRAEMKKLGRRLADAFPLELQTLKVFLTVLAVLAAMLAVEFAVLYGAGVNNTFGNPFLQALPLYLALAAPVLFLGKWGARCYITLLLPLIILATIAGSLVSGRFRIQMDGDLIPVILASSAEETGEFIEAFFGVWPVLLLLLGVALPVALLVWLWRRPMGVTRYTALLGVLLMLPYVISSIRYIVLEKPDRCLTRAMCTRMIWGYYVFDREFSNLVEIAEHPELPSGIRPVSPEAGKILGVIVIGESANRSHMSVYGYPRVTDPAIRRAAANMLIYDDVICAYTSTTWAIRYIFTMSEMGERRYDSRCTLVDVLKAGGYGVDMISNQYRWGRYDGPISMVFAHADSITYLQEEMPKAQDDALLPGMRALLAASEGPAVVILHLIGSHTSYDSRYPAGWGPFDGVSDETNRHLGGDYAGLVNAYDNSIAFTDRVLGGIIEELRALDRPAFMLYLSDHAETIDDGEKILRTGKSRDPGTYEIPFMVWLSDSYREAFPDFVREAGGNLHMPLQTDKAFWGLAALAQLTWDDFPEERNFFSSRYRPQPRWMDSGAVEYVGRDRRTAGY